MKLMTVTELAELMGISRNRVYELVRANAIPHIRIGGRQVRFSPEAVRAHLGIPDTAQTVSGEQSSRLPPVTPLRNWFRMMPDEVRQSLITVLYWIMNELDRADDPSGSWNPAPRPELPPSEPLIKNPEPLKLEPRRRTHIRGKREYYPLPAKTSKPQPQPEPKDKPKKFGVAEAAAKLGVGKAKVRQMAKDGVFFVPIIGNRSLYVETWIDEYVRLGHTPSYGWEAHVYRWGWNRDTPEHRRERIHILGVDRLAEVMKLDPKQIDPEEPVPIE